MISLLSESVSLLSQLLKIVFYDIGWYSTDRRALVVAVTAYNELLCET